MTRHENGALVRDFYEQWNLEAIDFEALGTPGCRESPARTRAGTRARSLSTGDRGRHDLRPGLDVDDP